MSLKIAARISNCSPSRRVTAEILTSDFHDGFDLACILVERNEVYDTIHATSRHFNHITNAIERIARLRYRIAGSYDLDRKSTRLNSSHLVISYAVFCLK